MPELRRRLTPRIGHAPPHLTPPSSGTGYLSPTKRICHVSATGARQNMKDGNQSMGNIHQDRVACLSRFNLQPGLRLPPHPQHLRQLNNLAYIDSQASNFVVPSIEYLAVVTNSALHNTIDTANGP